MCAQEWVCWIIWQFQLKGFQDPPCCFLCWPCQFSLPQMLYKALFSVPLSVLLIACSFGYSRSKQCEKIFHCALFIYLFLVYFAHLAGWTDATALKAPSPNHGTTRDLPYCGFFLCIFLMICDVEHLFVSFLAVCIFS